MNTTKDEQVRKIATAWCTIPSRKPIQARLTDIASALYAIRNDQLSKEEMASLSDELLSPDPEVMAAVEHYFYARSQVANAEYSSLNMKIFIFAYQAAKKMGADLRHNKNKPTTAASALQQKWALLGADQGTQDLEVSNATKAKGGKALAPPSFRLPPNFTNSIGGAKLDRVQY